LFRAGVRLADVVQPAHPDRAVEIALWHLGGQVLAAAAVGGEQDAAGMYSIR
jgi:hypothetical protein